MMEDTPIQDVPNKRKKTHKKMGAKKIYSIIFLAIFAFCSICAIHQFTNSVSATVMINSALSADGKNVLCKKKGVVEKGFHCRSFDYDPLLRVPRPKAPELPTFDPEEFKI